MITQNMEEACFTIKESSTRLSRCSRERVASAPTYPTATTIQSGAQRQPDHQSYTRPQPDPPCRAGPLPGGRAEPS